jgi:hypothetical protein
LLDGAGRQHLKTASSRWQSVVGLSWNGSCQPGTDVPGCRSDVQRQPSVGPGSCVHGAWREAVIGSSSSTAASMTGIERAAVVQLGRPSVAPPTHGRTSSGHSAPQRQRIQRTGRAAGGDLEHVGVNHGRGHVRLVQLTLYPIQNRSEVEISGS